MFRFFIFFVLALINVVAPMSLPDFMKPCSRNDPNLNDCAMASAKESISKFGMGDPSRNLPPLDPLLVKEMIVYVPNENGLKLVYKDSYFSGLSTMQLQDFKFDLDKKMITVDAMVNLDVKGQYDLSGKLLIVPIKSNGDSIIKLKNTNLHITIWYEHVDGDDGKVHWNIKKHEIKYDVEKAYFKLENLLNDKNISDQVNKLLNEMSKEIVNELGPVICKALGDAAVNNVAILLEQVPYDELMPE